MLQIGLTGGIAAGKSTVAAALVELGAVLIDADAIAREAVGPGTAGLAAVVAEFGPGVLTPDGALDRPALGRLVFGDGAALARLNAVVHPLVAQETKRRVQEEARDAVVVHDVPLIVENRLAAGYHLVIVVGASEEVRLERLVTKRGMSPEEARARIAAQSDDEDRRRVADVWIDNIRPRESVRADVARLWHERLAPYESNLLAGRRAPRSGPAVLVEPPNGSASWSSQADRLLERLRRVGGDLVRDAAHIGSTAVPGLVAKDVIDLHLGVASLGDADALAPVLARAGFPAVEGQWRDEPKAGDLDPARWGKRLHGNADPGRAVNLHVRVSGGPGWRYALAFRDWLRADESARSEYAEVKRRLAAAHAGDRTTGGYAEAKEPWFTGVADPRLAAWVDRTGWSPRAR